MWIKATVNYGSNKTKTFYDFMTDEAFEIHTALSGYIHDRLYSHVEVSNLCDIKNMTWKTENPSDEYIANEIENHKKTVEYHLSQIKLLNASLKEPLRCI